MDLVEYAPEYRKVMELVFGGLFICVDNETASKITFDSGMDRKAVTLDGDFYEPGGSASGGEYLSNRKSSDKGLLRNDDFPPIFIVIY